MLLVAKIKDDRLRYYGPGKPRVIQPGELVIDIQDEVLQAAIQQSLSQSQYLPLSGGTLIGDVTLNNVNLILGTGSGTKIGTTTSQKIGFYNATPVDQPATIADPAGGGTVDAESRTAIGLIIDRLQELGLIA